MQRAWRLLPPLLLTLFERRRWLFCEEGVLLAKESQNRPGIGFGRQEAAPETIKAMKDRHRRVRMNPFQ